MKIPTVALPADRLLKSVGPVHVEHESRGNHQMAVKK